MHRCVGGGARLEAAAGEGADENDLLRSLANVDKASAPCVGACRAAAGTFQRGMQPTAAARRRSGARRACTAASARPAAISFQQFRPCCAVVHPACAPGSLKRSRCLPHPPAAQRGCHRRGNSWPPAGPQPCGAPAREHGQQAAASAHRWAKAALGRCCCLPAPKAAPHLCHAEAAQVHAAAVVEINHACRGRQAGCGKAGH